MTWWPGWDSIADSGWWSHFWFWFGITCLFALGVSEVVSHFYGLRKDELVAIGEHARAEHQRDENAPRHLKETQKQKLSQFLSDKARGSISIKANITVADAKGYADEIAAVLQNPCGWTTRVDNALITGSHVTGVWLTVKDGDHVPAIAPLLYDAFIYAEIPIRPADDQGHDSTLQEGEVWLSIGAK